ncbi:hypothetical protein I4U23_010320 [Adineta vaga]|nr:hypothetical protein I4U23_010320 [Adineta vaga]
MLFFRRFIVAPLLLLYRPITTATSTQSVGIIDLILSEHQHMRNEYEHFKSIDDTTELDPRVRQWIAYIALHGHKEEIAFYPKVEQYLKDEKKGGHHLIEHGIKEHRQLESELKKLAEQSTVTWKQIRKSVEKLMHHLKEEESDILQPLRSKLDDKLQLELAQQFVDAGQLASDKPHPELSKQPEKAPQENIDIGLAEKHKDL